MQFLRKKLFLYSFVIVLITINTWSIYRIYQPSKASVKGIQTNKTSKAPTANTKTSTPTATLSTKLISNSSIKTTRTPTPTTIPVTPTKVTSNIISSPKTQPASQTKQYGGWYWQPTLKKSQVWIGTNSAGKDIWIDSFPTPTLTPTPITQTSRSTGTSSYGTVGEKNYKVGSSIGVSSGTTIDKVIIKK